MKKSVLKNISAVAVLVAVHAVLCIIYNNTYYNEALNFPGRFTGFTYYAFLMMFFLAAPLCYYITGRVFNGKADKKFYLCFILSVFGVFAVLGIVSLFVPEVAAFYRYINAPSYMYYQLFSDSVFYISIPAMCVSALFPAMFSRMGFVKKGRQNNEIKMDEKDEKKKSA